MKVLVTGATGFIGVRLVRALVEQGYDVRVLHRKNSDLDEILNQGVNFFIGDIGDQGAVNRAVEGVDVVFHLAGIIGYSRAQREAMEKVNVNGTQNIIKACLEHEVERLVYMSSVVAVGASFDKTVLNEDSKYNVAHLDLGYFETKKRAEDLVKKACVEKGLKGVMINPSTVYGPGDAKKGSRKVQLKVARGKFPFYPPGGVSVVHVDDVIYVLMAAIKKGGVGERYIVSGENILIKDLFKMIAKEAGVEPPKISLNKFVMKSLGFVGDCLEKIHKKGPLNSESAQVSMLYHWFENKKACREFGLTPRSAREAIRDSVLWSQKNL